MLTRGDCFAGRTRLQEHLRKSRCLRKLQPYLPHCEADDKVIWRRQYALRVRIQSCGEGLSGLLCHVSSGKDGKVLINDTAYHTADSLEEVSSLLGPLERDSRVEAFDSRTSEQRNPPNDLLRAPKADGIASRRLARVSRLIRLNGPGDVLLSHLLGLSLAGRDCLCWHTSPIRHPTNAASPALRSVSRPSDLSRGRELIV